jgi:hypothetical protein
MSDEEVTVRATQSIAGFVEGETVTLVRSRFVDRLIAQESLVVVTDGPVGTVESGLIKVVEGDPKDPAYTNTSHLGVEADHPWVVDGKVVVPPRNGSRELWANFLTAVKWAFPGEATRDALIAIWDEHADDIDLAYTATSETLDGE